MSLTATIVGIVPNLRQRDFQLPDPDPIAYLPFRTDPRGFMNLLVRSAGDPNAMTPILREEVRAIDPDLPLFGIRTMDAALAQARWPFRIFGTMFAIFALIALALSAVGLYAVTAYAVSQRTQEIGVRMALGAQGNEVAWLFLRRSFVQLAIGLTLGIAGAFGVGTLFSQTQLLVQNRAGDPITIGGIALLLADRRQHRVLPAGAARDAARSAGRAARGRCTGHEGQSEPALECSRDGRDGIARRVVRDQPRDDPGHVRHREAQSLQILLGRHARNRPRETGGAERCAVRDRGDRAGSCRAAPTSRACTAHTPAIDPGSQRIPACSPAAITIAPLSRRRLTTPVKRGFVIGILRAEAEVDDLRVERQRVLACGDQRVAGRGQLAIEHLDREDLRVGRLLANRRGHRRAVTEAIDVIVVRRAVLVDADAAADAADVWMGRVHAAVDHGDADERDVIMRMRRSPSPERFHLRTACYGGQVGGQVDLEQPRERRRPLGQLTRARPDRRRARRRGRRRDRRPSPPRADA